MAKIGKRKRDARLANIGLASVVLAVVGLVIFTLTSTPNNVFSTQQFKPTVSHTTLAPGPLPIVFMGDSLTAGDSPGFEQRPGSLSWARYVTEAKGSPWSFQAIPAVGGQGTPTLLARFDKDVISRDPTGVAILAGANDVLYVPLQDSLDNLSAMITKTKKAKARVFLLTIPPNDDHPGKIQPFNAALKQLAKSEHVTLLDIYPALTANDGRWKPGLTLDGTHPTVRAAEIIADQVLTQLK